jgi:hypothetical protein
MHKYPKYTHGFTDHDGTPRFYLRLPGRKRVPLPGLPWSPEFMEARERALAGDWTGSWDLAAPRQGPSTPLSSHTINRVPSRMAWLQVRSECAAQSWSGSAKSTVRSELHCQEGAASDLKQEVAGCRIELAQSAARLHRSLLVARYADDRPACRCEACFGQV